MSLCNVVVKIITKILANKLKPLMRKLGGENQASFIHGRQTADNISVAQDDTHPQQKEGQDRRHGDESGP